MHLGKYTLDLQRVNPPITQADGSVYFRLPITRGPCDKLIYEAAVDRQNQLLEDLTSLKDQAFYCRQCRAKVAPNKDCAITRVLPTPTEGWDEFVNILSCADDMPPEIWRVATTPGTCLIGDTYFQLHPNDIKSSSLLEAIPMDRKNSEETDASSFINLTVPISCGRCRYPLGFKTSKKGTEFIKLFQFAVLTAVSLNDKMQLQDGRMTRRSHAAFALLTASRLQTCRKFVVSPNETTHRSSYSSNAILIWIMNESARVAAHEFSCAERKRSKLNESRDDNISLRRAVKVLYSISKDVIGQACAKDESLETLEMEPELVASMYLALVHSTASLPPGGRHVNGLECGYVCLD